MTATGVRLAPQLSLKYSITKRNIHETFAVICAMGAKTLWQTPEEYMAYFYGTQIPATYHHRPSMLQDLEGGKRTEIEALTGYVSRMGREFGIATPICDTLSSLIRFRERHNKFAASTQ